MYGWKVQLQSYQHFYKKVKVMKSNKLKTNMLSNLLQAQFHLENYFAEVNELMMDEDIQLSVD